MNMFGAISKQILCEALIERVESMTCENLTHGVDSLDYSIGFEQCRERVLEILKEEHEAAKYD